MVTTLDVHDNRLGLDYNYMATQDRSITSFPNFQE